MCASSVCHKQVIMYTSFGTQTSRYKQKVFHYVQNVFHSVEYMFAMYDNLFVMSLNRLLCLHCD